jgi:hypothetical protein
MVGSGFAESATALTLAIDDKSQYHSSFANGSEEKTEKNLSIFRYMGWFFP